MYDKFDDYKEFVKTRNQRRYEMTFDMEVIDFDPTEKIQKHVKNYMGVKEAAVLPRALWIYYDWAKAKHGLDLKIMKYDRTRGDADFSEMVENIILNAFEVNEDMGQTHPRGVIAHRVSSEKAFVTTYEMGFDYDQIDYDPLEWTGGYLKNYMGVKEAAVLPRALWVYYDWAKAKHGLDLKIMKYDRTRGEVGFSDMVEDIIFHAFLINEHNGESHPPGISAIEMQG